MGGLVLFVCVCVANKICLEAQPEALPCSIEVDCGCNLTAEYGSRVSGAGDNRDIPMEEGGDIQRPVKDLKTSLE